MAAPVTHFEILSRNAEHLMGFYAKLFGWSINADNPIRYGLVAKTGNGIGGGIGMPEPGRQGHVTIYAEVPDPQATLDAAVAMGATVVLPVTEVPGMVTYALFNDPDGNLMGIVKAEPAQKPARKKGRTRPAKRKSAVRKSPRKRARRK
jgi:predicted enzyme related to lactoylglutathione lyase